MSECRPGPLLIAALALALATAPAGAQERERIESFSSDITVERSGRITVTEVIRVNATGRQIKRGIFRDLVTDYRDRFGNRVRAKYAVRAVSRDGGAIPYFTERTADGIRVYMGSRNVRIRPGAHTFTLTYTSTRQIGYFDDFDELYWNVTGNNWAFPIALARAFVRLPAGAPVVQSAAYAGPRGAKGGGVVVRAEATDAISFTTSRALAPGEGLTVAVAWPKGIVAEPSAAEKVIDALLDNAGLFVALAGIALLFAYYLLAWSKVGRDPASGTVIPLFEPPEGFSPAAVRYVRRMSYDDKAFASAIVSLAVKGALVIDEDARGDYVLRAAERPPDGLAPGEGTIWRRLFGTRASIVLEQKNHVPLGRAVEAHRNALMNSFMALHFKLNRLYLVPGVILTILALGLMLLGARHLEQGLTASIFILVWTGGCWFLVERAWRAWRVTGVRRGLQAAILAAAFLAGEAVAIDLYVQEMGALAAAAALVLVLLNGVFYGLMRAPTVRGRKVQDRIEGFRMYLATAEAERLARLNPPERTPELFERLLPYAIALDVEHEWAEQFAETLSAASAERAEYRPRWYSGRLYHGGGLGDLSDSLGSSFTGALASAATAPGSSSGSGGGGSSGGRRRRRRRRRLLRAFLPLAHGSVGAEIEHRQMAVAAVPLVWNGLAGGNPA